AAPIAQSWRCAARSAIDPGTQRAPVRLALRALTALLHLVQPQARLHGRLRNGLSPWRRTGRLGVSWPWPQQFAVWSEDWQAPDARIQAVERSLRLSGAMVLAGGDYDRWDLEVRAGLLGGARALMAVEDHGAGNQYVRFRSWPRFAPWG